MATIKEIAKMANVSIATVSFVLNNTAKISDETKKKVLGIAKEMNYRPNSIAKSLKIKKTNTIGIITEDVTVFNTPEIINGINEYAEEHGYHILLNNIRLYKRIGNNYKDTNRYKHIITGIQNVMLEKQVDGLIYVGSHCHDVSEILETTGHPVVYAYCYSKIDPGCSVNYDDENAAYDVTKYLIGKGHIKIAIITGSKTSAQSRDRLAGYRRALIECGIQYNPQYVKLGNWEYEAGVRMGTELLQMSDRSTAIFAMNDLMAGGVIEAARKLGCRIPDDISLVGFDNRDFSCFYTPRLTTMRLPLNEMGKEAAEILVGIISGKTDHQQKPVKLQCELVERESVKSL